MADFPPENPTPLLSGSVETRGARPFVVNSHTLELRVRVCGSRVDGSQRVSAYLESYREELEPRAMMR